MYSDDKLILQLLSLLKQHGVKRIVVSPGSRHFPLVNCIDNDSSFELYSVVDERSAAFFALGLIMQYNEPVVVTCTSGTSVINYGSAVVEAYYRKLPLLLLTADRLPELLGQMEDQVYKQDDTFKNFINFNGQLKQVKTSFDEWYCNRIINEGLLALRYNGGGPSHLNFPIESHHIDTFSTSSLPKARMIQKYSVEENSDFWHTLRKNLTGKKVMILWGQSAHHSLEFVERFNRFVDCVKPIVLTDSLANCTVKNTLSDTFRLLRALKREEKSYMAPDIVITMFGNYVFNGEIKGYLRPISGKFEHWSINPSGDIVDPFKNLTKIFHMGVDSFVNKVTKGTSLNNDSYFKAWQKISNLLEEPKPPYSELYAIGSLVHNLPKQCSLHIANSSPIRMMATYRIPTSVKVFCNRGVNGIDGCMSTAVGYAADSKELVFLAIGDLTFFYDMNSLWNRHLSKNMRILLLNNEGGAVMHMPLKPSYASILPRFVSAGHNTSARGWVESLGFHYLSATNEEECDSAIKELVRDDHDRPVLLEVFTEKASDVRILKEYYAGLNRETLLDKLKAKTKSAINKVVR